MSTLYTTIHYWLVDHPTINHFEWDIRRTPGVSPLFVTMSTVSYLFLTLLLTRFPRLIPSISSTTICRASAAQSLFLCLLSAIMALGSILSAIHQTPRENPTYLMCLQQIPGQTLAHGPTFFWAYVFYLSKILELGDTLLILLSGSRARRLSFLHVYHHASMVVLSWLGITRTQSMVFIVLVTNSSVHVLMYSYYFLRALGYRPTWKKLVTDCQIVQFWFGFVGICCYMYLHFTTGSGCAWASDIPYYAFFNGSLLLLFRKFHLKNYQAACDRDHHHLVKDTKKEY